jgi:hypothetical protein
MSSKRSQIRLRATAGIALYFVWTRLVVAHPEARAIQELPWHKEHFTHVLSVGYTQLGSAPNQTHADMKMIDHQACIVATMIGLDVDDSYAFDIDETVELTLTYAPGSTNAPFDVQWDQNGGEGHGLLRVIPEPGELKRTVNLKLDRARFAGLGTRGIDIAIGPGRNGRVALCDVAISRTWTTKPPDAFGGLRLTVTDADTGLPIPARAGIYDATGRAPLPSESAILIQRFADKIRLLPVAPRAFWPSQNRLAFYVNGEYSNDRLAVGKYDLVVTHGPEYRLYHKDFEIRENSDAQIRVALKRYIDMPALQWISGDDHIHLQREEVADQNVWLQVAAERMSMWATCCKWGTFRGPISNSRLGEKPATTAGMISTHWYLAKRTRAPANLATRFTKTSKLHFIRMLEPILSITKFLSSLISRAEYPVTRTWAIGFMPRGDSLWTYLSVLWISSRCVKPGWSRPIAGTTC